MKKDLNYFLAWFIIFSSIVTIHLLLEIVGFFRHVIILDASKLTVLILSVFTIMSLYVGFKTYKFDTNRQLLLDEKQTKKFTTFVKKGRGLLPIFGLMGTVIGMIYAFDVFNNFDVNEEAQTIVLELARGVKSALYTTLFGLAYLVLLGLQMWPFNHMNDE